MGWKITADGDCSHEIKTLALWKKSYDPPRQYIKKQRHNFANKGLSCQGYDFLSSHVWMWELDYKEIWALKNWCFWTVVLEKTLESPLDCKDGITNWIEMSLGNSRSWLQTGMPGVLQSTGSQRVGRDWVTGLNSPGVVILILLVQIKWFVL